jgi:DNA modification methylase
MLNDDQWHDAMRRAGLKRELRIASLHENPGSIFFNRSIRQCYTEIIVCRWKPNGTLRTNFPLPDVIHSGIEKDRHKWQQPISDSVKLIQCLSRPGETVCDLCVGSGTVLAAVAQVGGRKFVGSDIEQKLVNAALGRATG